MTISKIYAIIFINSKRRDDTKMPTVTNDYIIKSVANVYHHIDMNWKRDKSRPRKYHAALIFLDGAIEYYFPEHSFIIERGDVFILPENVPYSGRMLSDSVEYICVDFEGLEGSPLDFGIPQTISSTNFIYYREKFEAVLAAYEAQLAASQLTMKARLYDILALMLHDHLTKGRSKRVEDIIEYIKRELSNHELDLKSICGSFGISESQLRRDLRRVTGASPNEYIRNLRINRAKTELIETSKPIYEIAADCGFDSPYYFSKCFTEQCRITPTKFRKEHLLP